MEMLGMPILHAELGYMMFDDYTHRCTVVLRDAMALIFRELELDGTLRRLYENLLRSYYTRPSSQSCAIHELEDEDPDEGVQLDLGSMVGVLILHLLGVVVACVFCLLQHARKVASRGAVSSQREEGAPVT